MEWDCIFLPMGMYMRGNSTMVIDKDKGATLGLTRATIEENGLQTK